MHSIEDFKPGQTVEIRDYPNPADHDNRAGQTAVVTSVYNGVVTVNRDGYGERFIPSRLTIVK